MRDDRRWRVARQNGGSRDDLPSRARPIRQSGGSRLTRPGCGGWQGHPLIGGAGRPTTLRGPHGSRQIRIVVLLRGAVTRASRPAGCVVRVCLVGVVSVRFPAMGRFLVYAGFLLAVQGAGGLVYHFVGWFRLWTVVHRLGFLVGHEVLANVGLIAAGAAVMVVGDRIAGAGVRREGTDPADDRVAADDDRRPGTRFAVPTRSAAPAVQRLTVTRRGAGRRSGRVTCPFGTVINGASYQPRWVSSPDTESVPVIDSYRRPVPATWSRWTA